MFIQFKSFRQGWDVRWIFRMQTLNLEPICYFFGGQTLNLKHIIFFLEVRTLNLEPNMFFLQGRTLNLRPYAPKICKPWDLEPQPLNLRNVWFSRPLSRSINMTNKQPKKLTVEHRDYDWSRTHIFSYVFLCWRATKVRMKWKLFRFKGRCIFAYYSESWT